MREIPLSTCEKEFILKALKESKRIDGRGIHDYRQLQISFGLDWGSCMVVLGNTRILAQVTIEVGQPKANRPAEGFVHVDVEWSPMAAAHFSSIGRQSVQNVQLSRALKRCIVDSHVVDLESLCIITGKKVWSVRVTLNILNYDGNLLDACSVATICALLHFRRSDVSVCGDEIKIHSHDERDPLPLSIHHVPICVTFACFEEGKLVMLDPNVKEERIMDGSILIAVNKHREICMLQAMGGIQLNKEQVLRFTNIAVARVTDITEKIYSALDADIKARKAGVRPVLTFTGSEPVSVVPMAEMANPVVLRTHEQEVSSTPANQQQQPIDMHTDSDKDDDIYDISDDVSSNGEMETDSTADNSAVKGDPPSSALRIGEGGPSTWTVSQTVNLSSSERSTKVKTKVSTKKTTPVHDASESEEEETVCLQLSEQPTSNNQSLSKNMASKNTKQASSTRTVRF